MANKGRKKKKVVKTTDKLTGPQKAAVFFITLGTKTASKVMQSLNEEEIEKITMEIASMPNVKPNVVDSVMNEFYLRMNNKQFLLDGGMNYADKLLSELGDEERAERFQKKLNATTGSSAFEEFQENKMSQITNFIQNEHPQVAALIFSQLDEQKTAEILGYLDEDLQAEIIYRLSSMEKISSEVIREIEEVIKEQMGGAYTIGDRLKSGTATVAQILNEAEISVERHVLNIIEQRDAQMADEIKQQMFLFEDILDFDDRTVQVIINEMDKSDLVMGLKGIEEAVLDKFLKNMSERAAAMLLEDMEALGPVPLKDVKEAQQRMIRRIKELEDEGQITTRKMSEEEIVE